MSHADIARTFSARRFFINGLILTVSSLALRAVGIAFNVYLTEEIGEEGMGLFQLALSIYMLAATFASSGISVAMTRVLSERGSKSPRGIMISGMALSLCLSLAAASLLFFFAEPIAFYWLADSRTVLPLKIFAPSLVFMAISGCVHGYFFAERRIISITSCHIFEQAVRVAAIFAIIFFFEPQGVEELCCAIVAGSVTADALDAFYGLALYALQRKKQNEKRARAENYVGKIAAIALPVAGSAYIRAGLRTAENLLIPWGLGKNGYARADALSGYGVLKAMVMPIIFFPNTVISCFASLLIPELARYAKDGDRERIASTVRKVFAAVLMYAIFCAGAIAVFAQPLSTSIYRNGSMAGLLQRLALLVPVMYLDSATDAMLNALNQQVETLKVNTIDSVLRVGLLVFAIPLWGFDGYVAVLFFSNIFNAFLSIRKLLAVSSVKMLWGKWVFKPVLAAATAICASLIATNRLLGETDSALVLVLKIAAASAVYLGLVRLYGLTRGLNIKSGARKTTA